MGAFGTMNLMAELEALIHINHLCNQYGFDVISAGATVSMAIECFEKGIISSKDTNGIELKWGVPDCIIAMLNLMGKREAVGDVFADGVKKAAERLGKGSDK